MKETKYIILAAFFIAFGIGFIYLLLVRYFAGVLVWLSVIGFIVFVFLLASYFNNQATTYNNNGDTDNYDFSKAMAIILYV